MHNLGMTSELLKLEERVLEWLTDAIHDQQETRNAVRLAELVGKQEAYEKVLGWIRDRIN